MTYFDRLPALEKNGPETTRPETTRPETTPLQTAQRQASRGRRSCLPAQLLGGALTVMLAAATLLAAPLSATPRSATEAKAPVQGSGGATVTWQDHRFEPRGGEPVDAQLGTFSVPENRSNPDSRRIELSFVRFPSTAEEPGAPIVYLAGGPGGSGTGTAKGPRFPLFMALRTHADVIAFDQRGTGLSSSIPPCAFTEDMPMERPTELSWLRPFFEKQARQCAKFWAESGVDLNGYNTAQSADDLEDLRRALAAEKLSLWGISYGTHLALSALERHPQSFDRAILASAEGLTQTIKLPARTDDFFTRLDAQTEVDLVQNLRQALARLEKEPVIVETQVPGHGKAKVGIGAFDLQLILSFMVSDPGNQAHVVALAPALAAGDFSHLAPIVAGMHARLTGLQGMPEAMDAASGASPARLETIRRQSQSALLGGAFNFPLVPDWPVAEWLGIEVLPESFRREPTSAVPTLFLSGSLDGRTYTQSHREVAAGFKNASFVVVEGAGHNLFMSSPEVEKRILDFLARGETSEAPIQAQEPGR